jgi:hypothetical protein
MEKSLMDIRRNLIVLFLAMLAAPARAEDSEILRQLKNDVAGLTEVVAEQARRIEKLEHALSAGLDAADRSTKYAATPAVAAPPWHSANNWGRVKDGMSESQVAAILGQPTTVKNLYEFKTLFYEGEVRGSGVVNGNLGLKDGRVWQINIPVF